MGEGQWVPMKVTGPCTRDLLRHMGGGIKRMIDDPKQDGRAPGAQARRRGVRSCREADQVAGAMPLRDSITPAERRTRGAVGAQRNEDRPHMPSGQQDAAIAIAGAGTRGATHSPDGPARKVGPDASGRSHSLEAVLGKTRRTEFQYGQVETEARYMLLGHEAETAHTD